MVLFYLNSLYLKRNNFCMNDITLFERFPYSFAPNNAEKVIQEKAYKVVSSCKDGAVSEAIEYALENL